MRDQFLGIALPPATTLAELNERFAAWVDQYQRAAHGTTGQAPRDRYFSNMQCSRPAPTGLSEYFRRVEKRKVKKDRSFRLDGRMYEAPVGLIDRSIELRFHEEDPAQVEIYFEGMSFGHATFLDPHVNAKLGRRWMTKEKALPAAQAAPDPSEVPPRSGALPLGREEAASE